MLRDIERSRRTEAEHILGDMLARSRALGVATTILELAFTHVVIRGGSVRSNGNPMTGS